MCKYPLTAALGLQAAPIVDCLISSVKFEFCDRRSMANSMVYLCLQICLQVCILYNHSFFLHSFIDSFISFSRPYHPSVCSFVHSQSFVTFHELGELNLMNIYPFHKIFMHVQSGLFLSHSRVSIIKQLDFL